MLKNMKDSWQIKQGKILSESSAVKDVIGTSGDTWMASEDSTAVMN